MNFSSVLLSIIFHTGIFLSLITFFNPELHQRTKIQHDLVSFQIIENDLFEKQKQNKSLDNKQFKIYQTKKYESIQKLIKKNQSTKILIPKSRVLKEKNFEEKKKEIKKVKSLVPKIKNKINQNKLVTQGNIFNENPPMSVIPNIEKFRSAKLNKKFYGCSASQRSKIEKKNKKDSFVNKNVTISNLLGYFYHYDPNYINISNLLKSYQITPQKNINITELLNQKIDNIEICN